MISTRTIPFLALLIPLAGCGSSNGDDPTNTQSPTQATATPTATTAPSATPTGTDTQNPTATPTATATQGTGSTPTPTGTTAPTPTPTSTPTGTMTLTPTPTGTMAPTPTATATQVPTPTATGTMPPTPTPEPTPTAEPLGIEHARGMTYGFSAVDYETGTVSVGCYAGEGPHCEVYVGDTQCSEVRPILCILPGSDPNPGSDTNWTGGTLALAPPVAGTRLDSLEAANTLCVDAFGAGWRMAEWHDNSYFGKNLTGYGTWETDARMWVHIDDQLGNCWNSVPEEVEVVPPTPSTARDGLTYAWASRDLEAGTVLTGCYAGEYNCNAYHGDTSCSEALPILCRYWDASGTSVEGGYANGSLLPTPPLFGTSLRNRADADKACQDNYGRGWTMAAWHDNPSSPSLSGAGTWISDSRMWMFIEDQESHCWNRPAVD